MKCNPNFLCFALTLLACAILKDEEMRKGFEEYMEKECHAPQIKGNNSLSVAADAEGKEDAD